ncbi:phage major capsid protein, HK97 family [Methylorubrum populi BJ001]|jgi:HK97 family phage major capsid protein|uniref:Phage major capsid protein, HK97 family n=1 Tax=Methylorubrum populi (strain ATCC BAA-705 / NCIMB 13946 / BJ001) TaxID=441620 RepID=B1ZEA9_METPB|nr:phage major capsid protein [Methylorubrum populi]ACB79594.1 phage major capsid protein, HK97 family [Methylorubrum populi BJ001]OAH38740.1 capsid protein [Methylorubrum populi]PZP70426.1 MAG: phage major capsid protein [Methylorubrum populi]
MTEMRFETKAPAGLPENKAAMFGTESVLDEFARAFEAFKEANDTRLAEIETRLTADVVTEEKLARIDAALDQAKTRLDRISLDRARPPLGGAEPPRDASATEHKAAFDLYVRAGESAGLKRLEEKALSAGSGPDGGYLVPPTIEREVLRRLAEISPIRAIATVRTVSGGQYKRAVTVNGPAAGWVAETAPRPQTDAPSLSELSFPAMELYAMPAATQTLLDDAVLDIDAWLAEEVETAFAEQESVAFVTGNGIGRPKGFLSYDTVANASWAAGKLGFTTTGASGAFAASNPSDVLFDLIYALRAGYRQGASFVMNRRVQSAIRKFKDADGNYLWQPPLAADRAATLMGFPLVEAEAMPDISAGSHSIAFGDFKRGYLVVDRVGLRTLRDPYSAKPYVLFYTTKRVGGGVQDFAAIKLLRFA